MNISLISRAPKRVALTISVAVGLAAASLISMDARAVDSGGSTRPTASTQGHADATFEGHHLDLSQDWGDARACWVDERGHATCYRSEAMMDDAIVAAGHELGRTSPRATTSPATTANRATADQSRSARRASCSSSLRLYKNNWYVGQVLYLTQRSTWINMSWYGFDNSVSSYRVGACNSTFRSGSNGSGSTYWGGTSAYNSRSSMSGWNNVLSSVRIS